MTPRVFVSSTVRDLAHVRHAVRDQIAELGYDPVMSEHGEVGYLPDRSAAESCYGESRQCGLAILIIGKRYGEEHKGGISVTHNEYRTLLENRVPLVTLVERGVLAFKSVADANRGSIGTYPGMDHPAQTFAFLSEVMASPVNNGIGEFLHIAEAREYTRKQFRPVP